MRSSKSLKLKNGLSHSDLKEYKYVKSDEKR